jgi:hypothetical protein
LTRALFGAFECWINCCRAVEPRGPAPDATAGRDRRQRGLKRTALRFVAGLNIAILANVLFRFSKASNLLAVPYLRSASDSNSHSYVDLKHHPEQIDLIPEIKGWPELRVTLIEMNAPDTAFSTLGCEKAICGKPPNAGVSGYVQFRFEDIAIAKNPQSYRRLLDRVQERAVTGWPANDAEVDFELQSTVSDDRNEGYWSATIWLIVRNCATPEIAKDRWSSGLRFVRGCLLEDENTATGCITDLLKGI